MVSFQSETKRAFEDEETIRKKVGEGETVP